MCGEKYLIIARDILSISNTIIASDLLIAAKIAY